MILVNTEITQVPKIYSYPIILSVKCISTANLLQTISENPWKKNLVDLIITIFIFIY